MRISVVKRVCSWPWYLTIKFSLRKRTLESPQTLIFSMATTVISADLFEEATAKTNSVFKKGYFISVFLITLLV